MQARAALELDYWNNTMSEDHSTLAKIIASEVAALAPELHQKHVRARCGDDVHLAAQVSQLVFGNDPKTLIPPDERDDYDPYMTADPSSERFETIESSDADRLESLVSESLTRFDSARLSSNERQRIQQIVVGFRSDWDLESGSSITIDIPADLSEKGRELAARQLIQVDIELREKAGKSWTPSDYLQILPQHRFVVEAACLAQINQRLRQTQKASLQPKRTEISSRVSSVVENPSDIRFRPTGFHAKGGLGAVFRAYDRELSRHVALKEIRSERGDDPTCRSRFVFEAKITGQLEHPGVVPVYGFGTHADGRPYYAMRFVSGQSFRAAIGSFHAAHPKTTFDHYNSKEFRSLLRRFTDACNAIHFAHDKGILHRDIKPDNVMLGEYGETLVVDWGLAKRYKALPNESDQSSHLSFNRHWEELGSDGAISGTISYMSPEQALGHSSELTPASDIYSLGAMLFNMLTNEVSVQGSSTHEILLNVRQGHVRSVLEIVPTAPKALASICERAMALHPSQRYATATAIADDIDRWMSDDLVLAHAERESMPEKLGRLLRKYRSLTVAGVASLLTISLVSLVAALLINQARARERVAKSQAIDFYGLAGVSINDWLVESSDALQFVDGATAIRNRMLTMAEDDFRELAARVSNDPLLELERGRVFLRLGDIARRSLDTRKARSDYATALKIFGSSTSAETKRETANTHVRLGQCDSLDADFNSAIDHYRIAKSVLNTIVDPSHSQAIDRSLAINLVNSGEAYFQSGRFDEAESDLIEAIDLLEGLAMRKLDDAEQSRSELAAARVYLARIRIQQSDLQSAEEFLDSAKRDLKELIESVPDYPPYAERLADIDSTLAELYAEQGDTAREVTASQAACDEYALLSKVLPSDSLLKEKLAMAHTNHALAQHRAGDLTQAKAAVANAERIFAELLPVTGITAELLTAIDVKGQVLTEVGELEEAIKALDTVVQQYRDVAANADSADHQTADHRERFAVAASHYGDALALSGETEAATKAFGDSRQLLEALIREYPESSRYKVLLAMVLERVGRFQSEAGQPDSLELLRDAMSTWQALAYEQLSPRSKAEFAWLLATYPDEDVRSRYASQAARLISDSYTKFNYESLLPILALAELNTGHEQSKKTLASLPKRNVTEVAAAMLLEALAAIDSGDLTVAEDRFHAADEYSKVHVPYRFHVRVLREFVASKLKAAKEAN